VTYGRPDLPYNLCQVLQSREGGTKPDKAYCVSSGRAVHAGEGIWAGVSSGNTNGTGNEIEWSGPTEPFPGNRRETAIRIACAHLKLQRSQARYACNHREYAKPDGRKIDTNLDGTRLRADTDARLQGDDMSAEAERQIAAIHDAIFEGATDFGIPPVRIAVAAMGYSLAGLEVPGLDMDNPIRTALMDLAKANQAAVLAAINSIPQKVVDALPPSSGGSSPTLAQIQSALEAVIEANLGFLKPGQ
jgi:hypothetical protein